MSNKPAPKSTEKPPYKKIEYEDDDEPVAKKVKMCPAPIERGGCPASRCFCLAAVGCQYCGRRFCGTCIGGFTQYCMKAPASDPNKKHKAVPICSDCNHIKTGGDHAHDDHEIVAVCVSYCCGGTVPLGGQQ